MSPLHFDNSFIRELAGITEPITSPKQTPNICWAAAKGSLEGTPRLLSCFHEVAELLDLNEHDLQQNEWVSALSGQKLLAGMYAHATRYGGHQFGQWAGQLGDGRAMSLGELINTKGARWELQLKGAGQTAFSRRGDGRAVLRSSIREFLCSEAMFHLGVPTTRALSLIDSGEQVLRDMFYDGNAEYEPGAVVCRVAPSFIRFGHFEILAADGNTALLQQLIQHTLTRHFPEHLNNISAWFSEICQRTAKLMVEWLRVGFVHGVMNTDNMSILGLTIDYGPYGWLEEFDPSWTPNTTDANTRRYCYGSQPDIARWNLERLAEALMPILPPTQMKLALDAFDETYQQALFNMLAGKFGIQHWQDSDAELCGEIFELMQHSELDYTLFFQQLTKLNLQQPNIDILQAAAYRPELLNNHSKPITKWLEKYSQRLLQQSNFNTETRLQLMAKNNPSFILRNYLCQQAIQAAEQNDLSPLNELKTALRAPYATNHPAHLTQLRPEWARHQAGASMLSCSS